MPNHEISINMDKKCVRCGKGAATQSGICLNCISKAIVNGEMHIPKKTGIQPRSLVNQTNQNL